MTTKRRGDAGLSLIEVLVSLAIFALIGVAGLSVLNTVARTGERTEGRLERLAEMDRAFVIIRRDLAQMTVAGVTLNSGALTFQRATEGKPVVLEYAVQDNTLIRRIRQTAQDTIDQRLLKGIAGAEWRLLDGAREWHAVWPPAGGAAQARPTAVELSLEVWRAEAASPQSVTRLMALPAGQSR